MRVGEKKQLRVFLKGYITIAKYGLSNVELEDILSCDDYVLG